MAVMLVPAGFASATGASPLLRTRFRFPRRAILSVLAALVLAGSALRGQETLSLQILDLRTTPEAGTQLVASVVDQQGRPVKGLTKANFSLVVEGASLTGFSVQPVASTRSALSVVLAIDVSGSMKGAPIAEAKKAASVFLDQLDREDFVALVAFGSKVDVLSDFTRKKQQIREGLDSLVADQQLTWLHQATYDSLERASRSPTSRVAVVLLTDGKDEGSPRPAEDVFDRVRLAPVPVFSLAFGPNAQADFLRRVSTLSGGYFLSTIRPEDLSRLYAMVLEQLKNQYLFEWTMSEPGGRYTSTLTLNYRGSRYTAQRGFLYAVPAASLPATPPGRDWLRGGQLGLVLIVALAIVAGVGLTVARLMRSPAAPAAVQPGSMSSSDVVVLVDGKPHALGFSTGGADPSMTILPASNRGEVGLSVQLAPVPLHFPLVDSVNRRHCDELIITRHHDQGFFSPDKVYLLLPDQSVSRPDDSRPGHARIVADETTGRYQIQDLNSTAGTKVNGAVLTGRTDLDNGDTIMIGNMQLRYYDLRRPSETMF